MSFSPIPQSPRRNSRFPSQWSRKLSDRTGGLYKKANTLFHLERAKIAVLVSSGGFFHGYLSHGPAEWPELHQLAGSLGISLATPDDLDTVSQRYASRSLSVASTTSGSTITSVGEHDAMMQLLATLEEEPETVTSGSLPPVTAVAGSLLPSSGHNIPVPVWTPPSSPEVKLPDMPAPVALMTAETALDSEGIVNPNAQSASTSMQSGASQGTADHAMGRKHHTFGVVGPRVHKKRANENGKNRVTTRSRGSRTSKIRQ